MTQYKSENLWLWKSLKVYLPEVCPQRPFFAQIQAVEYIAHLTVQSSQS